METSIKPGPVGTRLRQLRKENGWTLDEVTAKTGIAKGTLSKIENGRTKLRFTTVNQLASGLELPITALTAPPPDKHPGQHALTRLGGGAQFETTDANYEILCDDLDDHHLAYMRIEITCRRVEDQLHWHSHPGKEFLYVLRGSLELHRQGYKIEKLKTGDAIAFDALVGHKYVATGRGKTELLCTMQASGFPNIEPQ